MKTPDNVWRGWRQGELQVHFVHTGVGESVFLIFPDSTTMLVDCGDAAAITRGIHSVPVVPGPERLAGEWVARYVMRANPHGREVDWLAVSHFHSDHAGTPRWQKYPRFPTEIPGSSETAAPLDGCARSGIALAAELLRFRRATDRGWPDYRDPVPLGGDGQEQHEIAGHVRSVWKALRRRDGLEPEPFRLGASDQFVPERGQAPGFSIRNVCANGRFVRPDGSVDGIYADWIARERPSAINENALSLGFLVSQGPFRLWLGGDFSADCSAPDGSPVSIEDEIADSIGPVAVAKINHHGHHTTSKRFFGTLSPRAWIACVWDNLHLTDDTAEAILSSIPARDEPPLIVPTVLPVRPEGERPWWKSVPPQCRTGAHVIVTVPPGGETFSISLLDARDEEMRVVAEYAFETK